MLPAFAPHHLSRDAEGSDVGIFFRFACANSYDDYRVPSLAFKTWDSIQFYRPPPPGSESATQSEREILEMELSLGAWILSSGKPNPIITLAGEVTGEISNDGNGAPGTDEYRVFSPHLMQGARGCLDVRVVDRNQAGVAGMNEAHVHIYAWRNELFNIALVELKSLGRVMQGPAAWIPWPAPWLESQFLRLLR